MNKRICIIFLLLTCRICIAQNLVPNGDFEQYSGCPTHLAQIDSALFWFNPCLPPYGTLGNNSGSPDYFNSCTTSWNVGVPDNIFGYQFAHSGNGYAGLILFYTSSVFHEYIEIPLTSSLMANTNYHFEMYISIADYCLYTADTIGAYFSDTVVAGLHTHDPFLFIPQIKNTTGLITDTMNWTLISGSFIADGGESHLLIGNFNTDVNTDTMLIGSNGLYGAYVFIDDVSLTSTNVIEEQNSRSGIKIYPSPFNDKLNIAINNTELSEIVLYDISTRKLLQQKFTNSISINTKQLAKGIYMYEVRDRNGLCKKGKVVKD